MRKIILILVSLPSLLLTTFAATPAAVPKTNIVLIFADDLGWMDPGFQGNDYIETPHLDRLSREGMVFTQGYAAAGNCMPSRAALLSGQYSPRTGVYAVQSTDRGNKAEMRLVPVPNTPGLAKDNVTIAEVLQTAGYATGIFGKWHLDDRGYPGPAEQGFATVFQSAHGWGGFDKDKENPKGIFSLTRAACEFIEKNRDRPFFVYLPHYAIHEGLAARPDTLAKFKAKPPGKQSSDPLYAACTYDLDAGVGLLLQKLADLGLEKNTLVVFTSDNGGTRRSSQEPLRGNKGSYYEGGIREPFVVRWPGVTQPGSRSDVPVINVDLYPTFLAAAGVPAPTGKVLDGENLVPALKGGTLRRTAIFWHFPGYLNGPVNRGRELDVRTGFRNRPTTVIRQGDWKLHLYHEEWQLDGGRAALATNHAVELYHLKDEIGERRNLAASHPQQRDQLLDALLAWQAATKAIMPSVRNPRYAPGTPDTAKPAKESAD
jgi:arylsulfatase A-like enzyme